MLPPRHEQHAYTLNIKRTKKKKMLVNFPRLYQFRLSCHSPVHFPAVLWFSFSWKKTTKPPSGLRYKFNWVITYESVICGLGVYALWSTRAWQHKWVVIFSFSLALSPPSPGPGWKEKKSAQDMHLAWIIFTYSSSIYISDREPLACLIFWGYDDFSRSHNTMEKNFFSSFFQSEDPHF